MVKRLNQQFQLGDPIEFSFDGHQWQGGRVVLFDAPGLWVRADDNRTWFVTNTRHIRHPHPPKTDRE